MAKRVGVWLFIALATVITGLNLYWVARGLMTGGVPILGKGPNGTTLYATAPGAFIFNLSLRALIAAILGAWAVMVLRIELRSAHRS
jgi:hypothetical protein